MQEKTEIWKPVVGMEKLYEISSFGNLREIATGKMRKPYENLGYLRLNLKLERKVQQVWLMHRLVAFAFLPQIEGKTDVNHKDSNRSNNHVDNLEWCTKSENIKHAFDKGRIKIMPIISKYLYLKGEDSNVSKLKNKDVLEIRALADTVSKEELSKKYGVTKSCIGAIIARKSWKHI